MYMYFTMVLLVYNCKFTFYSSTKFTSLVFVITYKNCNLVHLKILYYFKLLTLQKLVIILKLI